MTGKGKQQKTKPKLTFGKKDFSYHHLAASNGDAVSQRITACAYINAEGVEKSYSEAFKWFSLAAEQGCMISQCMVGNMYFKGKGVEKDVQAGIRWFERAAEQGCVFSQNKLADLYFRGEQVPRCAATERKWLERSAEGQDADGHYGLGQLYECGWSVGNNFEKARSCYFDALIEGKKEVLVDLSRLLSKRGEDTAAYAALLTAQEFEVDVDDDLLQKALLMLDEVQVKRAEDDATTFIGKLLERRIL